MRGSARGPGDLYHSEYQKQSKVSGHRTADAGRCRCQNSGNQDKPRAFKIDDGP